MSESPSQPGRPDPLRRWRGLQALVHDAVDATLSLVQAGQESTGRRILQVTDTIDDVRIPAQRVEGLVRAASGFNLATIRTANRAIERGVNGAFAIAATERAATDSAESDAALTASLPMRSDVSNTRAWWADAAIGVVNAAVGDRLHGTANGLDADLCFRVGDHYLNLAYPNVADADVATVAQKSALQTVAIAEALPAANGRLALFVHGLGTSEWSWCLNAEQALGDPAASFGSLLQRDLDLTPVYLRYNTGRRISHNGERLAHDLQQLLAIWPVPVTELTLIGHSMGGLVIRSACHHAEAAGLPWPTLVRTLACLGSPHDGAPLARFGNTLERVLGAIDLPATLISARILAQRSGGIRDLQSGAIRESDWDAAEGPSQKSGDTPAAEAPALLPQARHLFVAASVARASNHPASKLLGDLLVRVPSASGVHLRRDEVVLDAHHVGGVLHHHVQSHPAVYALLLATCQAAEASPSG